MIDAIGRTGSGDGFLWQPGVLSLHILSDALIALAYFSIPLSLLYIARKRRALEFPWVVVCCTILMVTAGASHLMEIWVLWNPDYWLSGAVKAITALATVPTAILLVRLIPQALRMPSPSILQQANETLAEQVADRKRAEADARGLTEQLEQRVAERTQQLETANRKLLEEARERSRAEQDLRESERRVRAVVDSALSAVIVMSAEGRIIDWNSCAETQFGWTRVEVLGRMLSDTIIPLRYREAHAHGLSHFLATGEGPVFNRLLTLSALRRDGEEFPIELSISPLQSGDAVTFCGFITDITERQRNERKQQQQLRQLDLLNRITHAIGERQDLPSILQVVINSLEDHLPIDFGCALSFDPEAATLIVTSVGSRSHAQAAKLSLMPHMDVPIDHNGLSRCVQGQLVYEPDTGDAPFALASRLARGGLHSLVAVPLLAEGKVCGLLVVARKQANGFDSRDCELMRQLSDHVGLAAHQAKLYSDLQQTYDDLRRSQQTVLQQERLSALGQMASGVAHDINNAISPIGLYTESLLEREPNLSERARKCLVTIQRAIEDVAQTVGRMREFYRPREPQYNLAPVQLNHIVEQGIELTRARWSNEPQERGVVIDLTTDLAADLPLIMGADNEIRDALTNLIFNAVDAMPKGGTLTLRTCTTARPQTAEHDATQEVLLEVSDSGVGMDETTRLHCLEPFYTTKGERGTGLGLAMVYGMVQRHSAELRIESTLGEGTTARLVFSAARAAAAITTAPEELKQLLRPLRILIVDDDPLIVETLRYILEHDGHEVTAAEGGEAGIEAFVAAQKHCGVFDAVITDLGMPHIDGRRVAKAIKAASAITPVILLTGWGERLIAENDVPPHVDRVLNKPPKLEHLRGALIDLVAQPMPASSR